MFSPQNTTLICPKNDLESQTIVEIAKKFNMDVRVSEQAWGARLDKEPPENLKNLKRDVWIVEIPGLEKEGELRHDGHDVSVIDHHNYQGLNRYCQLSSLEQFAGKIEYELNGEERLIAINDSSYIWGLIDAGVPFAKIRDIRRKDLLAQGWKEEDFTNNEKEYEAMKETISQFASQPGPIFFHETDLHKTGHLVDLFHMPDEARYESFKASLVGYARVNILLVKKAEGIIIDFSGKKICRDVVVSHFFPLADDYWLGGRKEFGFAGFKIKSKHGLDMIHDKLNDISVELIKKDSMCQQVRRLHDASIQKFTSFFVFPFSFSKKKDKQGHGWSQKQTFPIPVEENQLGEKWEFQQNYAEYIYFHDYVRSFLFPQRDKKSCKKSGPRSPERPSEDFLTFYQYELTEPVLAELEMPDKNDKKKTRKLSALITGIYMHIYPGNIGILVIETSNSPDNEDVDKRSKNDFYLENNIISNGSDLLLFHNMFRRIYPAYFEKKDFNKEDKKQQNVKQEFQQIKNREFPKSIAIKDLKGKKIWDLESRPIEATHFEKAYNCKYYPCLSSHVAKLLDDFFDGNAPKTKSGWGSAPQYFPLLDDRMLVYSYVAFPEDARKIDPKSRDVFFSHFLYVDNPDSDYRYDPKFIEDLMEKQRYKRWDHLDTRIGSTRYSTVFQYFGHEGFLYRLFVSMYYQMFLLITYYRARLIRFSDEIARIADKFPVEDNKSNDLSRNCKKELRDLHTRFMRFMNIDWFTEVTNQDQGIEIFKLMREAFELEPMYSQVKDEIERADELAELYHNREIEKFNKRAQDIGVKAGLVGLIIGLLAIITGFFGMNFDMIANRCGMNNQFFWGTTVVLGALTVLASLILCGVISFTKKD